MSRVFEPNRRLNGEEPEPSARRCLKAVSNTNRRRVLRVLHQADEARSPNEVAEELLVGASSTSYDFRVLRECGVIALTDTLPVRGSLAHFYASVVKDNELVGVVLDATQAEDEKEAAPG